MSTQSVGSIKQATAGSKAKRPQELTVKSGENLANIAKKFGMSQKEFLDWTGLKSSNLKAGQKIPLPTDTVPEGKGLLALARNHGMTLDEFCKLNNIPKTYNPSKGEVFYVKTTKAKIEPQKTEAAQLKPAPKKAAQPKQNLTKPTHATNNKQNFGSTYKPDELGKQIFKKACDYYGAVGKPDFDALIDEINPKNVSEVLNEYVKNPANKKKESLINTITSEIRSDKQKRKDAVMKVYDALARKQGTPAQVREGFVKELNKQFNSFGMVSTKKLDETLNRMMATGEELAVKMEHEINHTNGAVGKESFNELLLLVNPNNVEQVIKGYEKLNTGESLIEGMTSEVTSNKNERKKAVMHIYDTLAKAKNIPAENRAVFVKELNDQFNSWGMVNTGKMDEMIKTMLEAKSEKVAVDSADKTKNAKTKVTPKPNEKVIKGGFITAVGGQLSVASTGAKPPIPIDEKGNVIAEVIKFKPSNPNGPLKGKTIMVNAGHGWKKSKVFDQGTSAVDVKGKTIPEWYKNRNFADKLIKQLSAQGATVIYTAGAANLVCDAKRNYKADMLISLHCNAAPTNKNKNGLEVFYPEGSAIGKKFAQIAEKRLDEHVSFGKQDGPNDHCKTISDKTTRFEKIGLLQVNKNSTPSILIEMGYQSNEKDLKNIDWKDFQEKTMGKLVNSVKDYYGVK